MDRRTDTALWLLAAVLVIGLQQSNCQDSEQLSNIKRLRDHLMKKYDKNVRPVVHHSNTTVVEVTVFPLYLIELNELRQAMYMDTFFLMGWNDDRLKWEPHDFEGIDHTHFGAHEIWQPDITIYNNIDSNIDPKGNTHVLVYSSGLVLWFPPATVTTFCPIDYSKYPYDQQTCNITIGSWSHHGFAIDLEVYNYTPVLSEYEPNPEWNVVTAEINKHVQYYNCCKEPYPSVEASFTFQRNYPPALKVAFGPVVASMVLILSMFWLPAHSGKKILTGSIAMIVVVLTIGYVASSTSSPVTSYVAASPIISALYIVTSAILMEILVISLTTLPDTCQPPQFLVPLLSGPASNFLCLRKSRPQCPQSDRVQLEEDSVQTDKKITAQEEWYIIASAADRLFFVLFFIIIVAVHKSA